MRYSVVVWGKRGGCIAPPHYFYDETKARDYYTDMLVRYPNDEVKFEETITSKHYKRENYGND